MEITEQGGASLITRRSFLAGLAAVTTAAALDPFLLVRTDRGVYENLRLGLTARLPAGWEYGSIADFVALRARQVLLDEVASEYHALKDPETLPVFIFVESAHAEDSFGPTIAMFDDEEFTPPDSPDAEARTHLKMLRRFARSYRDLQIVEPPTSLALGNTPATISKWSYLAELDGEACELSVMTVLLFRRGRAHTLHMVDKVRSPHVAESTWSEFLSSIRFR